MRSRVRLHTSQIQLRNGFYIEVCVKGMKRGVKIRNENKDAMQDAASEYAKYKQVIILGEYKNGVPVTEMPVF